MFESFFISKGKFHKQCDGVAVDSPLGTTSGDVLVLFQKHFTGKLPSSFETNCLQQTIY